MAEAIQHKMDEARVGETFHDLLKVENIYKFVDDTMWKRAKTGAWDRKGVA